MGLPQSARTQRNAACASAPLPVSGAPAPEAVNQQLLAAAREALACGRFGLSERARQPAALAGPFSMSRQDPQLIAAARLSGRKVVRP